MPEPLPQPRVPTPAPRRWESTSAPFHRVPSRARALALATLLVLPGCASPGVSLTAEMETAIKSVQSERAAQPDQSALSEQSGQPTAPGPAADANTGAAPDQRDTDPGCPGVRCLSIAVTGDVLLHPPLVDQARLDAADGHGLDFAPMLAGQRRYVQAATLGICHLETPLAPAGGPYTGWPEFSVPPQVLPALVATGYDACSTASNHTMDEGTDGLNRTLDDLDAAGLAHDGSYRTERDAQTPTILTTDHGKVGFISAAYGSNTGPADQPWQVNELDTDSIIFKAHAARVAGADLVVVAIHAGTEYETEPNADQQSVARTLLASKDIDLVYGHHAHVVQPLQKIDGKWVVYGLGNNIASHETPIEATREGLLVRVTFSQDDAGNWTTSDIAWVPSLQSADPPHRWCSLTAGSTCTSPDADTAALARTTATVNLYGAAADGAHLLDDH